MSAVPPIPEPRPEPARRVPGHALPLYRYVPGLNPHPFRHPDGHMYTDGNPPEPTIDWTPEIPWMQDIPYLYAADLFDHRYYWEAHEAWEALWHRCHPETLLRDVLQSMIQLSAAILKMHMGHSQAADSLCDKACQRLLGVEAKQGPTHRGLNLPRVRHRVSRHLRGGPWPLLPLERTW